MLRLIIKYNTFISFNNVIVYLDKYAPYNNKDFYYSEQ